MIEIIRLKYFDNGFAANMGSMTVIASTEIKTGDVWMAQYKGTWAIHRSPANAAAGNRNGKYRSIIMIINDRDSKDK